MLLVVERLFSIPCIYCLTCIGRLWRSHLAHVFKRGPPSPSNLRPLTDHQRKLKGDEFIGSIDTDAIHAGAKAALMSVSSLTSPMAPPGLSGPLSNQRSMMYEIRYVLDYTNIPIPWVYAYGRSRLRRGLGCGPKIVGAVLMRKNKLQVDGYIATRSTATTANEFFGEQYHLLYYMWQMPS
ncbi:hypothetical protein DL95DRAFT_411265 [Leptodontidium sp. 2 PMI_412]|nr:hypothetical protein DL95DRAFT_411265 [Leptodontidium sp. 2 PMI_412]